MAQKKKNKVKPNLPKVEKDLKDFIADDQGKMTRTDVAKLGVSLAVLGMMMLPESAQASHCQVIADTGSHTNSITPGIPTPNCASHTNVSTHNQVTSCHGSGGWGC